MRARSATARYRRSWKRRRGSPRRTARNSPSRSSRNDIARSKPMTTRPPVSDWTTDWDHLDEGWRENPYPLWDELRKTCPVAHTERYQGVYLPTRYEDVKAVAHDTEH